MNALKNKFSALVGLSGVVFNYHGKERVVTVERLEECKNGNLVLRCVQQNDNNKYKSFNVSEIVM